ncbi:MAG TPA: Bax inhibitor-1/YccA family protein, partial [Clostridia bacterium]
QMVRVYAWMFAGLLITAGVSFFTLNTTLFDMILTPVFFLVLVGAEIALVWYLSSNILKMRYENAMTAFVVYSALNGFTLSITLSRYIGSSILNVFLITAVTFGFISFVGLVTKQDLTGWGPMLLMGLVGIIIASIVNLIMHSSTLYYIVSFAGVAIFLGLTAYDSQKIKEMYYAYAGTEKERNIAILGALELYLDFINLFIYILRIFGRRR